MVFVTALWRLKRKPPIPVVNTKGRLTLLFRLERRADLHGSTRDKAQTPLWMPQRNPEIHLGPGEEPRDSGLNSR